MIESRKKNTSINLIWSVTKYIVSIITAFTLRTLTLRAFGDVFSGLISLYSNIISILSITELGIGVSLIYKMYKPIAEGDDTKVRILLVSYKKIYYAIASIILILGLIILPFLEILAGDVVLEKGNIYYIFLIYLINCLVTYIVGHRRALLFAMQKNWIENLSIVISMLLVFPIQIYILNIVKNCYLYLFCETIIKLIECLIIIICSNKKYKKIMKMQKVNMLEEDKKELIKNTYALSFTKISTTVFKGMDSVIISICLGVGSVFLYSNYYLILTYLFSILNLIFNSLRASVGNFINTKSKEEIKNLFKQLSLAMFFVICFCTVTLFCLYQPFMQWWGNISENNMLLPLIVPIIMSLYFYIDITRKTIWIFKDTAGLFWGDRYIPLIASIINVILSVCFAFIFGVAGVILASLISVLLPVFMETKVVFKELFYESPKRYWIGYLFKFVLCVLEMVICFILCESISLTGIIGLLVKLIICGCVTSIINILVFMRTTEFKGLVSRFNIKVFK